MNYKKGTITTVLLSIFLSMVFAGGIVHNWNQSADYIRTFSRNASTDIDAAFYNPAGITSFQKGLYLAFHSQTITQAREITSDYSLLHESTFEGDVIAPVFPNFYFAYVTDDVAISGGFVPIGGGGSAEYKKGLPSFEMPVSDLKALLASSGVTDYAVDVFFEGSSVYLGGQLNVATKLDDNWSVFLGGRYVSAKNIYEGHLKDIQINPGGTWMPAPTYFEGSATQLYGTSTDLENYIALGAIGAGDPFVDPVGLATLQALGFDTTGLTNGLAAVYFDLAGDAMMGNAAGTADALVDAEQTGTGFTGMIGCSYQDDRISFGFRHEFLTKLAVTNDTAADDVGMFPDGEKSNKDMPAVTTTGIGYKFTDVLSASASLNYYHHGGVNWDGREDHVDDGYGLGFGVEYQLTDPLLVSCGYLHTVAGTDENSNSDFDHSLDSNTFAGGFRYQLQEGLAVTFGVSFTDYVEFEKSYVWPSTGMTVNEAYEKETLDIAIGFNYAL